MQANLKATVRNASGTHDQDPSQTANTIAPFAVMATNVYFPNTPVVPCGQKIQHDGNKAPLPPLDGWARHTDAAFVPDIAALHAGMYYEVWWRHDTPSGEDQFTIVFRGTDDWMDWRSNLHWFLKHLPGDDQYALLPQRVPAMVARCKEIAQGRQNTARFFAAGHSLGGGLAQEALYVCPDDITRVYAFDPSPVTAYYDLPQERRERAYAPSADRPLPHVLRIYESGEILAYVRNFLKLLYPVSEGIHEVRFNFDHSDNAVEQHNMRRFACHLMSLR